MLVGACKRFGKGFSKFELITCGKKRGEGDVRVVTVLDGDCKGRKVCIVDDLVRSGGTLIECAKALLDLGAAEVSCFVVHAEFPKGKSLCVCVCVCVCVCCCLCVLLRALLVDSWKKFLPGTCPVPLANFWVCDTCCDVTARLAGVAPFHVISIADDVKGFVEQHSARL